MVHIYAQPCFHQEAYIWANKSGLKALSKAISLALKEGAGIAEVYAGDGEGYQIRVGRLGDNWQSEELKLLALPYTEDFAQENREQAIFPDDLWRKRGY